jgi:hypothetical protein
MNTADLMTVRVTAAELALVEVLLTNFLRDSIVEWPSLVIVEWPPLVGRNLFRHNEKDGL